VWAACLLVEPSLVLECNTNKGEGVDQQKIGSELLNTVENIVSALGDHEYRGYFEQKIGGFAGHYKAYELQFNNTANWFGNNGNPPGVTESFRNAMVGSHHKVIYQYNRREHDSYFRMKPHKHLETKSN
jgi:hypothetical protein